MNRLYRWLAALVPPPRNEWIRAHQAELKHLESRRERRRWGIGLLPLTMRALWAQLREQPGSLLGGTLARSLAASMSTLDLMGATGLLLLVAIDSNQPAEVPILTIVLLLQGGYTMAMLATDLGNSTPARALLIVASTLAVVAGLAGFIFGAVANSGGGHREYGPMTVALLIGIHGLCSLAAFTGQMPSSSRRTSSNRRTSSSGNGSSTGN